MVDPKLMHVSMDEEDRTRLIRRVTDFSATAPGGTRRTLREFQQLAGWINWLFNVFPLLKPALLNVYAKIGGKVESHAKIFVSKAVVRDLDWFKTHVQCSSGVHLFENIDWNVSEASIVAYCDACLSGLGFYFEHSKEGFQCVIPCFHLKTQFSTLKHWQSFQWLTRSHVFHPFCLGFSSTAITPTPSTFSIPYDLFHLTTNF